MFLRAPVGCTAISHEGRAYPVGADGVIEVEDHLAPLFLAHGFAICAADAARPAPVSVPEDAPDLDTLNRRELFALLREKNVRVRVPITNAGLREAARRALAGD